MELFHKLQILIMLLLSGGFLQINGDENSV